MIAKPSDGDIGRLLRELFGSCIREQLDQALAEKLPQFLGEVRLSEARRPHRAAGPDAVAPEYLSRQQAAAVTGYSLRTITRLIDKGKLRACGPRRDRITRFEIERMMSLIEEHGGEGGDSDDDVAAEVDRLMDGKK